MALGLSPSKMKDMVGKAVSTNIKMIEAQGRYAEGFVKRNTAALVEITDARISSFQELVSAKSFTEVYENSVNFESTLRDKLMALYDDNTAAAKDLGEEVKELLEVDEMIAKVKDLSADVGAKVKDYSDSAAAKAKSFSEEVGGKVKGYSDSAVATVKSLSDSTLSKVKGMSSGLKPAPAKPAPKAKAATKAKAPARKSVAKKAPVEVAAPAPEVAATA
ncbi:MAG: hypothetical protein WDA10_06115 [Porticoccaceae bacterium]|jgi:hypothetical protein|nr:hypothetical protein [Porticoccaceae bacterium]MEA3300697.1 hypothetical protein [Pseudomonadota bacterium]HLS98688.1 hypothetical protein [Porticoccaceae bacterium]